MNKIICLLGASINLLGIFLGSQISIIAATIYICAYLMIDAIESNK